MSYILKFFFVASCWWRLDDMDNRVKHILFGVEFVYILGVMMFIVLMCNTVIS